MIQYLNGNKDFDNSQLIIFFYRWRKLLISVSILAIIVSIVFSSPWFITPKYESSVIMFPVATNSVSKVLISQNSGIKEDILGFGEDEQVEQLLQILNSNLIRDKVIDIYNLMDHYEIKPGSKYKYTKLYKEYESNVKFRRTEYMAVKVRVLDKDPQMAADIANHIAVLVDSVKNQMQKERAMKAFWIVHEEYEALQAEVQVIVDSLSALGMMGVNDYERQSEVLNEQLAIAIRNKDGSGTREIQKKLDLIGQYGSIYMAFKNALEFKTEQLILLRAKYREAKVDAEQSLPQKFVINSAYKAERKSYPIRSIIVLVSLFSAIFLTILTILIFENFSGIELKKKRITQRNFFRKLLPPEKEEVTKNESYKNATRDKERLQSQSTEPEKETTGSHDTVNKEDGETGQEVTRSDKTKNTVMDNFFNNSSLLTLLLKWKWHLAIILLIAIILAAIFSSPFFITPKFKSVAIVYPANVSEYSDESETEQMFQMLQSQDITNNVIAKFNLAEHYEIEASYKYFQTALNYEYSQNVKINKTPYDAISIEVLDKDPFIAADMANSIIDFYNLKIRELHNSKYLEVITMYEVLLKQKRKSIDSLQNELYKLSSEYGLLAYEQTSDQIMRGYLQTIMGSSKSNINTKEVNRLKENMEKHGGKLIVLVESLKQEARTYADFKVEYEDAWRFYNSDLTYCNVVTSPFPSDKKATPIRWLIVVITALVTFFFSMIVILIVENYRSYLK